MFNYQNAAPGYYGQQFNNGMGGVVPNPAQFAAPKTGNWLSSEDLALLQKNADAFNLSITPEEKVRALCNHYLPNGQTALVPDTDGSGGATCSICGAHISGKDYTPEEVQDNVDTTIDILESSKVYFVSLPRDAALQYYVTIALLKKVPQLYQTAVKDFAKYEGVDTFVPQNQSNPFAQFQSMINPMFGMGMGAVPYGAQAAAPQAAPMQGAPMYNPVYGQYQPQPQGFAMNPQGAAAPGMAYGFNPNMPVQPGYAAPQATPAPQAAPAPAAAPAQTTSDKK